MGEAEALGELLNENVDYVSVTQFGDAKDAARDVRRSERKCQDLRAKFVIAIAKLCANLEAGDIPGAMEVKKAMTWYAEEIERNWIKALLTADAILYAFGEDEDYEEEEHAS